MFPDTDPGELKSLIVRWEVDGEMHEQGVNEHTDHCIIFPPNGIIADPYDGDFYPTFFAGDRIDMSL